MEPLPLPSHVHYELLLQLLERQTSQVADYNPTLQEPVKQLIITLRKALAQQKQLEALCQQTHYPIEYRWSLNSVVRQSDQPPNALPQVRETNH